MTSTTSTRTALAIVLAAVTLTAFAPGAYAAGQDRGGRHDQMQAHRQGQDGQKGGKFDGMRGGQGKGQFLAIGCGPNAAERIETGLVKLGYRVDATAEQKTLLEDLKTAALAAQSELDATCETLMPNRAAMAAPGDAPAAPADGAAPAPDAMAADAAPATRPDMLEMMKSRLQIEEARVAAMGSVLPKFEAFYNSLSDEQKANLQPRGRQHDGRGPGNVRGPNADGRPGMDRNG